MPIGILSAMREEIETLIDLLDEKVTYRKGKRTYYTGQLFGRDVILVFSRWGKVASATTTTHLITEFKVEEILFTGVAGALDPRLNIGDLVIGVDLYQHDMDPSPLLDVLTVPLLRKKSFLTDEARNNMLMRAARDFLIGRNDYIRPDLLASFGITDPASCEGAIASGDQFISEPVQVERIRSLIPNVLCAEMEGAAVAQVCYEYEIPFNIIRTISDRADHNSHVDFEKFASQIASLYAAGVIENYFRIRSFPFGFDRA